MIGDGLFNHITISLTISILDFASEIKQNTTSSLDTISSSTMISYI